MDETSQKIMDATMSSIRGQITTVQGYGFPAAIVYELPIIICIMNNGYLGNVHYDTERCKKGVKNVSQNGAIFL